MKKKGSETNLQRSCELCAYVPFMDFEATFIWQKNHPFQISRPWSNGSIFCWFLRPWFVLIYLTTNSDSVNFFGGPFVFVRHSSCWLLGVGCVYVRIFMEHPNKKLPLTSNFTSSSFSGTAHCDKHCVPWTLISKTKPTKCTSITSWNPGPDATRCFEKHVVVGDHEEIWRKTVYTHIYIYAWIYTVQ